MVRGKIEGKIKLLNRIKNQDIFKKISFLNKNLLGEKEKFIEVVGISGDNVDKISQSVDNLGGNYENLGYGYGIIKISVDNLEKLLELDVFQYIELPKTLYTNDFYSNRDSCINEVKAGFNLYGEGILVGFVDTGIDYKNEAFINKDGTSRIECIWDLELGKIFSNQEINEALKNTNIDNSLKTYDLIGHGTHVAGIACGGGKISEDKEGVAPKSKIAMVKATRGRFSISTQIMRGIHFLVSKAKELKMPLVINLSLSTNDGAHNGSSLLEKYIETVSDLERVTIVIAAGNEGSAAHHVGGDLRDSQSINVNMGDGERDLTLSLYHNVLSKLSIEVIAPTGKKSGEITITEGFLEGNIDGHKLLFYASGAKPFDLTGEVLITIVATEEFIITGNWQIKINKLNNNKSNFDMWLPILEGLNPNTKFLEPNLFNTLGIPATVKNVISVGSYNNVTNNISVFTGRGKIFSNEIIKPEIIAPGENILSATPDGFDTKTGTSMASPHVAGVAAILMEWGIVKNNDRFLYGERLKSYLVRGAKRDRVDEIYPNSIWGYGTLCLSRTFDILRNETRGGMRMYRARKIVEYYGDIKEEMKGYSDVNIIILDDRIAVIEAPNDIMKKVLAESKTIVYIEKSPVYTLNKISPIEASGSYLFNNNPYLSLTGRGVLVGIVDTGIDYLNEEFIREDDTTKIVSLWDQTIKGNPVTWHDYGKIFSKEDIEKAIKDKKAGKDPYLTVESKDEIGHGTMVAGLIGARGKNPNLVGAAPDCNFVVVKLKEASKNYLDDFGVTNQGKGRYENGDILLAVRHIIDVAKELFMPIVIYIPLGTNVGSHDGHTIIERYIDDLAKRRGVSIVTCTGNEGDEDLHTQGTLANNGDTKTIELMVDENERNINFEIWFKKPDKVSLAIVSPSGEVIEKIPAKLKQVEEIRFVFEKTKMLVEYLIPEEITGDEVIKINATDLKPGIWQFKLIGDYIVDGRYDAWLPQRQLIEKGTKFLSPSQYITLEMPSTAENTIVASYYNQNNNATMGTSGRGYTRDGRIKPDIAAGGVEAITLVPGGGTQVASGASVAGAVLAGACALMMQWGIVDGNDKTMYSVKMKTYIIRGAKMRSGDTYPNKEWGYGMLDMKGIFDNIRAERFTRGFAEYSVDDLFVRMPKK